MIWFEGRSVALAAVVAAAAACSVKTDAGPQTPAPEAKPAEVHVLQERPDRLIARLPNGLLVVVQEIRTAPVVSAQVWVKTGSIYEQEHVGAGLSHFLEHLLVANTTTTRSETENKEILGRIGARVNASTGLDGVRYYVNTTAGHVFTAVELLTDWIRNTRITPEEYERERSVIEREVEMGQGDADRIFWRLTQSARFRAHPARHPTIGYLDEFLDVTREEIVAFYRRMYVPNNMVFVVSGDVAKDDVLARIADLWRDAEPRALPELSFPVEPELDEPREAVAVADVHAPRIRLAWPGTRLAEEGDFALDLLAVVLGQGESSRLSRSIRDEQGLVSRINAYNLSFYWERGFFSVDAEVRLSPGAGDDEAAHEKAIATTGEAILAEVERIARDGITEAELARAKRQTLARVIFDAQTAQGMANRLASDLIATGDPDYLERYAEAVQKIPAAEVREAARRFLRPERLIRLTLLPASADRKVEPLSRPDDHPGAAELPRVPVDLDNRLIVERLEAVTQERDDTAPAIEIEPVRRVELDNGLRVLVARSTTIPAVSMGMFSLGGLLGETPGREGTAAAAASMLVKGTTSRTAEEIAGEIEDLGASLHAEVGRNTTYVAASSLREDWRRVLELVADVTLNPTFPEEEWRRMQPRLLAAIDRQSDSWNGELRRAFLEAYFGDHPWATSSLGRREVVAALEPGDLHRAHHDRLGASETAFAIVGDIDPDEVVAEIERLFGSMPAKPRVPFDPPEPLQPEPGLRLVETRKPLAAVQIGLGPGVTRTDPDYYAVHLLSRVLSNFPSGWLDRALRGEGPGLVYAVGAGEMAGLVPGYVTVLFNSEPARVPEALKRSLDVVTRIREETVPRADLGRAKAAVLTAHAFSRQTNADRAMEAALNDLYGLGLDEPETFVKRVETLDAEDIRRAARAYLGNPVTIVLTHDPRVAASLDTDELAGPKIMP